MTVPRAPKPWRSTGCSAATSAAARGGRVCRGRSRRLLRKKLEVEMAKQQLTKKKEEGRES